jgi:hypothetical protein
VTLAARIFASASLAALCGGVLAQSSSFEARPASDGGGATIANPYGGEFVYRAQPVSDGRRPGHYLLGERIRDEFTLFSAEEEEALWRLREQFSSPSTVTPRIFARSLPRVHRTVKTAAIDWPRVVVQGTKTCVPHLAFSELADWRDHLVCWSSETRVVE